MSFQESVNAVLAREGGYVNDPRDRGGETNFGITLATAKANGFDRAMSTMTREEAIAIYKHDYWDRVGLDEVARFDAGCADKLFDIAVNMGTRTAGQFLQRSLNLLNRDATLFHDLKVDGAVGPNTLAALTMLGVHDKPVLRALLWLYQGRRYIEIIEHDTSQERFTRGWINRLIEQVQRLEA